MALNEREFYKELYLEHLEEAAFLYEQRLELFVDPAMGWLDLEDIDERFEAHLDALVVGDKLALQVCRDSLAAAEFDVLHVLTRLFCRIESNNDIASIWRDLDYADTEKVNAVADALKWECPPSWQTSFMNIFTTDRFEMYALFAPCVSYHQIPIAATLYKTLQQCNKPEQQAILIKAIGRTDGATYRNQLTGFLASEHEEVRRQAAIALLRLGEQNVVAGLDAATLPCVIAVSGIWTDIQKVHAIVKAGQADADCLLALGLSGVLATITDLLHYLNHPDYAPTAALALQLITGAQLYESVHVKEQPEEDELFEHEKEDFRKGILPKNIDGLPYGTEVQRLSLDQAVWSNWLQQHREQFQSGLRYRFGKPYEPKVLLELLLSNQMPALVRSWMNAELAIRYGIKMNLEPDDLVIRQKHKLSETYKMLQTASGFAPGAWYFAGQRQA